MARGIAEVSNLIFKKKYPEAGILVQTLIGKFTTVATLYDLQGNVFYLQRDLTRALESYKKSNSITPNNLQTVRMIERLEQLQVGKPGTGGQ
jgi:hypothetical protein